MQEIKGEEKEQKRKEKERKRKEKTFASSGVETYTNHLLQDMLLALHYNGSLIAKHSGRLREDEDEEKQNRAQGDGEEDQPNEGSSEDAGQGDKEEEDTVTSKENLSQLPRHFALV